MRPVDQTTFAPQGNCLQACLASIFDLPLNEVVDTTPPPEDDHAAFYSQHNLVQKWLEARGYWTWNLEGDWCPKRGIRFLDDGETSVPADFLWPYPPGYYIGGGKSPRGVEHAVVMRAGYIVHDPHPARDMALGAIDCITVLVRCQPMPASLGAHAPTPTPKEVAP